MRRCISIFVVAILMGAAGSPAALGDIFAFAQTAAPAPRTDIDLILVDANTGQRLSLPAGINTSTANEFHPSVSADGQRVVFDRVDRTLGTDRVIEADLSTGQQSDLFSGFEAATVHPTSSAISPNGSMVLSGGPTNAAPELTNVSAFPNGPYAHTPGGYVHDNSGEVAVDPVALGSTVGATNGSPYAFRINFPQPNGTVKGAILYSTLGAAGASELERSAVHFAHPTLGTPFAGGATILAFDQHAVTSSGDHQPGDIAFCDFHTNCNTISLVPGVNTSLNETRPAFTPDGRYLGFIRNLTNGHELLAVWDSQTQTLINDGVDLGTVLTPDSGNLSLYERPVLALTSIPTLNNVSFSLLQSSLVGILVQRVVGHHKLFGVTVPTLKHVGRVPFGRFKAGRRHVHWDLRVDGRRLSRGIYQVTVRALNNAGQIRDLGKPHIIHVR